MRPASLLVLLLASAPFALAHDPPRPVTSCQAGGEATHDYLPPAEGTVFAGADGNLADCDGDLAERDFDGEPDHGLGGVLLLVESGGGATSGTLACHGGAGHHGATVRAWDVAGFGPRLRVTADASRVKPTTGPDCGDGYSEPCAPQGAHEPAPPPFDAVGPAVEAAWLLLVGPGNAPCLPEDRALLVEASATGPSFATVPFGPGIDGAYGVFVQGDPHRGRAATAGHVWT